MLKYQGFKVMAAHYAIINSAERVRFINPAVIKSRALYGCARPAPAPAPAPVAPVQLKLF